ncbi:MAG: tRNA (guanosine(37)-N1)-methyltransferase TrmD [Clostridia bacterium]|nr:tRNA (guanosine(37)-N1)-methyltransferase TrmD [Clostridia bacterium]MDR3645500.1 tRNA (guanosine(37)-N1)-methyltransferase TrmD [Clostridia bacterium]
MRIDLMTLFPQMCEAVMNESIIGRAVKSGILEVNCHNIRDYTTNRQRQVDDYPYGGGTGMIMQVQPIFDCFEEVVRQCGVRPHFIYMSPQGAVFRQCDALRLSQMPMVTILCGHYEGVDERTIEMLADEELSAGDFVLTGGELPALMVADAVARLVPGVLAGEESWRDESIASGLLEYPQYSRPAEFMGRAVPEVLLSGHHANIVAWRRHKALERTLRRRPDLLETAELTQQDRDYLESLKSGGGDC